MISDPTLDVNDYKLLTAYCLGKHHKSTELIDALLALPLGSPARAMLLGMRAQLMSRPLVQEGGQNG